MQPGLTKRPEWSIDFIRFFRPIRRQATRQGDAGSGDHMIGGAVVYVQQSIGVQIGGRRKDDIGDQAIALVLCHAVPESAQSCGKERARVARDRESRLPCSSEGGRFPSGDGMIRQHPTVRKPNGRRAGADLVLFPWLLRRHHAFVPSYGRQTRDVGEYGFERDIRDPDVLALFLCRSAASLHRDPLVIDHECAWSADAISRARAPLRGSEIISENSAASLLPQRLRSGTSIAGFVP